MKLMIWRRCVLVLAGCLCAGKVCGQSGGVVFSTIGTNWVAPWYLGSGVGLTVAPSELPGPGGGGFGFPVGNTPLSGTGFTAELWGRPEGSGGNLQPLAQTTFRTGGATAGLVKTLPSSVSIPLATIGQRVELQLRVWDNINGTITSWAGVMSNPNILFGASEVFTSAPLAESAITLQGIKSCCLTTDGFTLPLPVLSSSTDGVTKFASFGSNSRSVFEGDTVTLKVEVPNPAGSVQWRFQGIDLPGETNQSLILTNAQMGQAGVYEAATSVKVATVPSTGTNSIVLSLAQRLR